MANQRIHSRNPSCAGPGGRRRNSRGFTLLELMIVCAVIVVLAIIAVSSYGFANVKTRRNAAKACLTQSAQYMERYYTTKFSYNVAADPPATPHDICDDEVEKFYTVGFTGTHDATHFTVQAVPTAAQDDGKCGTLSLNQAGTKTPATEGCW